MTQTLATPKGGAAPELPLPWWDRWFHFTERGASMKKEVVGGFVSFLTSSYILFVNPAILTSVTDRTGLTLEFVQVMTVTALVAGVMSILMGVIGRFPALVASGMGLNAYVAFGLVGGYQLTWADGMGVIVGEGLLILAAVLVGWRQAIFNAIPGDLKHAIAIGIGMFIALIGLVNAGIVVRGEGTLGDISSDLQSWNMAVVVGGLLLTAVLVRRGVTGAYLIGIMAATLAATVLNEAWGLGSWQNGIASWPNQITANPDFSLVGNFSFDFVAALGAGTAIAAVVSTMLADFFDTSGTVTGVAKRAGLTPNDEEVPHLTGILVVDSMGALGGGAASASSATTYIESMAGVDEGARTGIASVVTGLAFLACLWLSPLAAMVPAEATAFVLVLVGWNMMKGVREIDWESAGVGVPAFATIVLMPFTYSITNGIGAGFLIYSAMAVFDRDRRRETHWLMYLVSAVFAWYFIHGAV